MAQLHPLDWLVIGGYFVVLGIIVWRATKHQNSSTDYFLAGRNMGWFVIGASLFASNIGSEHLVGLAGSGAKSGVAMAHYELHAWCLLVLGWVLLPFYFRSQVFTMPEFLERRFGPGSRWVVSLVSLTAYVFTKVSVTVYAGGTVIATVLPNLTLFGLSAFWTGALSMVVLTGIYTVLGGLRAVVYTDAMQAIVLLAGSLSITVMGLNMLGGWDALREACGSEMFNLWRPASDPDFPWPGMLFAAPIVGLWYWCTDQYIVQRTLAARNLMTARRGTIFGSYLKITPVFLFIVPGMIAFALAKTGRITLANPDDAFPALVSQVLPIGLRGLVVAGLLAALMSSLSSIFNSCSTLFTVDVYEKIRPGRPEAELVTVGRLATGVVVVLGIVWIPVMQAVSGALYEYLQSVQAYLAPPLTAVFFLGVFIPRLNAKGALTTLVAGFLLGMAKLGAQVYANTFTPEQAEATAGLSRLVITYGSINFLTFCVYLFAVSCAILILVSLSTAPPPPEKVNGLTYSTCSADERRDARASWTWGDVIHTAVVLAIILGVYVYFSG